MLRIIMCKACACVSGHHRPNFLQQQAVRICGAINLAERCGGVKRRRGVVASARLTQGGEIVVLYNNNLTSLANKKLQHEVKISCMFTPRGMACSTVASCFVRAAPNGATSLSPLHSSAEPVLLTRGAKKFLEMRNEGSPADFRYYLGTPDLVVHHLQKKRVNTAAHQRW